MCGITFNQNSMSKNNYFVVRRGKLYFYLHHSEFEPAEMIKLAEASTINKANKICEHYKEAERTMPLDLTMELSILKWENIAAHKPQPPELKKILETFKAQCPLCERNSSLCNLCEFGIEDAPCTSESGLFYKMTHAITMGELKKCEQDILATLRKIKEKYHV